MPDYLFRRSKRGISVAPTWAVLKEAEGWHFTLRAWASKERKSEYADSVFALLTRDRDGLSKDEKRLLADRIADFIADDDSNEEVEFNFAEDPEVFRFSRRTDLNGVVLETFQMQDRRVRDIAEAQNAENGWLTIQVRCNDVESSGQIKLLHNTGLSIVSDIDDTIKVTEILKGRAVVLRNTFLQAFQAVEGMAERYIGYGEDVDFHYVSGGPWQLYDVVAPFLITEGRFPMGTFHMRNIPKNPFDRRSWEIWRDLISGESTVSHKKNEITALLNACPGRDLILIGDSGEQDPEIYAGIRSRYPDRIREILIRDVRADPSAQRLAGMTIIPP